MAVIWALSDGIKSETKGVTVSTNEVKLRKVTLFVSSNLHGLMKEYAKRKRLHLGAVYDQAMQLFLAQTKTFMGSKRQNQLKKG